eukprot:6182494-Pleurochrysis_carterae.AAC.3
MTGAAVRTISATATMSRARFDSAACGRWPRPLLRRLTSQAGAATCQTDPLSRRVCSAAREASLPGLAHGRGDGRMGEGLGERLGGGRGGPHACTLLEQRRSRLGRCVAALHRRRRSFRLSTWRAPGCACVQMKRRPLRRPAGRLLPRQLRRLPSRRRPGRVGGCRDVCSAGRCLVRRRTRSSCSRRRCGVAILCEDLGNAGEACSCGSHVAAPARLNAAVHTRAAWLVR